MWNHTEGLSEIFGRVCYTTTLSSSKKNFCSNKYQYAPAILNIQYQFHIKIGTPQIKSCSSKNSQDLVQKAQYMRYV